MCGIAGFAGPEHSGRDAVTALHRMCSAIQHRGPDDEGVFVGEGVGLGMRRLSIIDLAASRQPLGNENGRVHVVFNGEIYNYRELRKRLLAAGHRLKTSGDTETLVHLYEEEDLEFVHSLRGMFSFALWDDDRRRLVLGRDRIGIKPLYYWEHGNSVAFASELRSLLTLPEFQPRIDPAGVASYLSLGYVREPLSIFQGVRKLPPGHRLTWTQREGVHVERYWSPVQPERRIGMADAAAELRSRLVDAVQCHLEADVPLGLFLSGGLDSSSVAAMVRQLGIRARTFSIGFGEAKYDESADAAAVARHLGMDHTEFIVRDCPDILDEVITAFDEPFADSSAVPTLLVAQLARQHVKVALSGDGGDELFGGYTRYMDASRFTRLRPPILRTAASFIGRRLPFGALGRNRILDLGRSPEGRYIGTVAKPLRVEEGGFAAREVANEVGGFEAILDGCFEEASSRDFLTQLMLVDLQSYLPGDILTKVDRASMATSLEARVPLLDHELVEFAVSLPADLKIGRTEGKLVLRHAMRDLLPARVFEKPKQGFAAPVAAWFRGRLGGGFDAALGGATELGHLVDLTAARRMYDEHQVGRRDHGSRLWRLFVLAKWLKALEDGRLMSSTAIDFSPVMAGTRET